MIKHVILENMLSEKKKKTKTNVKDRMSYNLVCTGCP